MSASEPIFQLLKDNKIGEAIEYVSSGGLSPIDCTDEHGTTPLQYAAFRGLVDLCALLLRRGADVNAKSHDQGYSALMFAAISNHKPVVELLLASGADTDYRNTIGRTASQMAAFVNSHECVDLINGYISKPALAYYTDIRSVSETEPKLPKGECLDELHKLLINSSNYSPIRVVKLIKQAKDNVLLVNIEKVIRTLDAFVRKAFRNEETECPNDVLAFKLHFYKFIFEFVREQRKLLMNKLNNDEAAADAKVADQCIKLLIAEEEIEYKNEHGGHIEKLRHRVFEEKFLRECLRQFAYKECALLRQMVAILAKQAIGSSTSAQFVITSCLNGQRLSESLDEERRAMLQCSTCTWKQPDVKRCSHCKKAAYCDQFCQRLHWPIHKNEALSEATVD